MPQLKTKDPECPQSIRRTRLGCWNCKARRRRCTEDKPSCSGCVKRGLQCSYGIRLLWQDEAESMGIAFGRAGMKDRFRKKTKKSIALHYLLPARHQGRYHWLNTTSEDVGWLYNDAPRSDNRRSLFCDTQPPAILIAKRAGTNSRIPSLLSEWPSLGEKDTFLFQYFSNVCTAQKSLVIDDNPWREVILPLCYQSEGLLDIAVAWAAHDIRNQRRDRDVFSYDEMVLRYKCRSLKYFRNMVPRCTNDPTLSIAQTQAERDSLLLLAMLHSLLEIATGSVMEWTYHMKGALMIMEFYTRLHRASRQENIFSPQVLELVYSFFSENDTFLATTGDKDKHYEENVYWSVQVRGMFPFLGSVPMKLHPCRGLSSELLDIISSTTKLASSRHEIQDDDKIRHFMNLQRRLSRLRTLPERAGPRDLINLQAAAFEEAAWIYLYHAIQNQLSCPVDDIKKVHLPKLLDILEEIHAVQGPLLGVIPYPMWALFIASCSVSEDERRRILEWFTILKSNRPISTVPSVMTAVETIWKRRDLDFGETASRSSEYSLNWGAAISQLGWKMSMT
ncbi:hypothetical protein UA08_06585 [Talaromyces atroroseus]|uniref:Zn(2)-C6 fungal-type domain-containing protein n=1 Tax=Talaromyces atroroseus TaxID=1441469 RepID=A0A225AUN7_TALAT|nr:hypothetical protein UA08_06585 [Talaromyces atroroseus]OKL58135.1 hypothetical protein UA08_06585 [Talaromyces atroroseus]